MAQRLCPLCAREGAWTQVLTTRDVVSREPFTIVACPSCQVLRTVPVPEDLTPYYDTDLGDMMKASPSRVHASLKRILLGRELRRIISRVHSGTFLDIGCGTGDFTALIHCKGLPVVAVDASAKRPLAIEAIRTIPYYQMDFERSAILGFEPAGPYTVIVRHVLEHLKDPVAFLKRMIGYGATSFYIVVPNAACLERRLLGQYWNLWDPPRHLWHFTPHSLQALLGNVNLAIVDRGFETIPNLVPSLYRFLRLKQFPSSMYNVLAPKGTLSALSAPLNLVLPHNVLWALAQVRS